jgi:hypothetical protein
MESLERSKAVIELGKRLVAQLNLGEDELAQWMAHVIAERIHDAEISPPEGRVAAQHSCAELIFQLWERRYHLPARIRPFSDLEPLLRTLDALDASKGSRFRYIPPPPSDEDVDEEAENILSLIVKFDSAARTLIQYFLATAAEQASENLKPWIQSAVDAGADISLEVRVVEFVNEGIDRVTDDVEIDREKLENKIQTLESFSNAAAAYAAELRNKHGILTGETKNSESGDER